MKKFHATEHARTRMQQRAISELQVQLIRQFGEHHYQKGGERIANIPEKLLRELRHAIDKIASVALVLGEQDKVITVLHQYRKIDKTQSVA